MGRVHYIGFKFVFFFFYAISENKAVLYENLPVNEKNYLSYSRKVENTECYSNVKIFFSL